MSFVFICCCRPFLRGRDDSSEFYHLLGLQKGAPVDDIKRAYRNKSLQMHPDKLAQRGQTLTPEAQAQFQRMKEAYECLADPVKKRNYDELGEFGMKFLDDPSSVDPQVLMMNFVRSSSVDRCAIFSGVLAIAALILLFPVLLCLRADGTMNIPWTGVWAPLWLFDALIFYVLLVGAAMGPQRPPEGLEGEYKDDWPLRVLHFFWFCANLTFQIFLSMRLDNYIDWAWSKVFAPWFVWEGLNILTSIPYAIQKPPEGFQGSGDEATVQLRMMIEASRENIIKGILRTIFCVLVVLKLDGVASGMTWWTVFTPLWVYFGLFFMWQWTTYAKARLVLWHIATSGDVEVGSAEETAIREEAELLANRASFQCCTLSILLTFALLMVARIAGAHYTVFIIFIPLFIIVGCFTCVVGCGICCVTDPGMTDNEGTPLNPAAGGPPSNSTAAAPTTVSPPSRPAPSSSSSSPTPSSSKTTSPPTAIPLPPASSAGYRPPAHASSSSSSPTGSRTSGGAAPTTTAVSASDVRVSVASPSSGGRPKPSTVDQEID